MKLLIVDFLDSYTHNIPAFLRRASLIADLEIDITTYITLSKASVQSVATSYHGVVLSAGPGTVECEKDIGSFAPALLSYRPAIPVYGICLGFQAICSHFGGTIHRLASPHHGLISEILSPEGILLGRSATRYHSLEVKLGKNSQEHLELLAVAYNYGREDCSSVMEVKHHTLPFWAVQYHPESVYSHGCEVTVLPFLQAAHARSMYQGVKGTDVGRFVRNKKDVSSHTKPVKVPVAWDSITCETNLLNLLDVAQPGLLSFVLLDSSSKGPWDILAAADTASLFRYSVRNQHMSFSTSETPCAGGEEANINHSAKLTDAWLFLADYSTRTEYIEGPSNVPFWGGFIGYFGYEFGLAELGLDAYKAYMDDIPEYGDIQLLWSTETLVYNKETNLLYAISLKQDNTWIEKALEQAKNCQQYSEPITTIPWVRQYSIDHPNSERYIDNIKAAQEEIKAGNSYEICLTAPSVTRNLNTKFSEAGSAHFEYEPSLAQRFEYLRTTTPAEFMSCMRLGGLEMLSASPEEFLSYNAQASIARMKPIKGTLPKSDIYSDPISFQTAYDRLHEPKVIAENLMIVDLVRNDLSRVSSAVSCPELMQVEDIGPMYQLVSTVQAEVSREYTAWDLIRYSIPPGSMTGAPKRRSCEILQQLERRPRGLYSGITGYIDVRGDCQTSVNIRNMVRYPGESHWTIGAGGAITSLSDPLDEWHERQLKAASVCRSLKPSFSVLETIFWSSKVGKLSYLDEHVQRLLETLRWFGFKAPIIPEYDPSNENAGAFIEHTIYEPHEEYKMLDYSSNFPKEEEELDARLAQDELAAGTVIENVGENCSEIRATKARPSKLFHGWIKERIFASGLSHQNLQISLAVDIDGVPSLSIQPVMSMTDNLRVTIRLDPLATSTDDLEPFITKKTTNRTHYNSARLRTGVYGLDEVLMFRTDQPRPAKGHYYTLTGADTDWLTEGSYTNVAVWDNKVNRWITPSAGCMHGIMRSKLLEKGEIVEGDVQRQDFTRGTTIKLFNSVRGVFEGVIH